MDAHTMKTYVILYNIRSVVNVASVFRTADCAGVESIFLVGYTPTPIDRFGRVRKRMQKIALGATETVPWRHVHLMDEVFEELDRDAVAVAAVEQHDDSIDYRDFTQDRDTAYIFGNELDGVPELFSGDADVILEIPMRGEKESLNIATTAGVILFNTPKKQDST